ncbi:MAG: GDP-mannose 4,6-dehydratase [Thermoplasmata archaeon]|uniref:GDP-mannose 4,6-dehydratase n=1 Tax=Candidatus Sysuiplasma superficiale TaxID=2823368 RepID=A0A8J7YUT6_9ARCH|nr:GDP-mannose 4,6-dehydratase [Candidatus Sysuiplasma superficiale]MBX8644902.1 GDP-mannose 4,6-dehydratase [Candidatus Sysuiplasma superficiale]
MKQNVLITGISGFVGPHLARAYLDDGCEVYGLVRRRADGDVSRGLNELGINNEVKKIEGNVEDLTSLMMAFDVAQPDIVFHLAAQSFVHRSFINPLEVINSNGVGTANMLEAMRLKSGSRTKLVFAGSSEEYGFVALSERQVKRFEREHGKIFPPVMQYPELPIKETNPLRPVSPYAVTKVFGEYLCIEYAQSYGLKNVVSRGFNHEGARRGSYFVTASVAKQVSSLIRGETDAVSVGNVEAFRDWTHIDDMVKGYRLLAEKGEKGQAYNIGSQRTNSVAAYILMCFEASGHIVRSIQTINSGKKIEEPNAETVIEMFGAKWRATEIDRLLLNEEFGFSEKDGGFIVNTDAGRFRVVFDAARYRPTDVPILLSDTAKIRDAGFSVTHSLYDIVRDQLNYYADPGHRKR